MHASKIASKAFFPCRRSASCAKSIIMIAFFFTSPTRRITPTQAYTLSSVPVSSNARKAPKAAKGMPGRMVIG
jgi:hypothetical protein